MMTKSEEIAEMAFRRGFQQGATAGLLASTKYPHVEIKKWVDLTLYGWRYSPNLDHKWPPGVDGEPWMNMGVDE